MVRLGPAREALMPGVGRLIVRRRWLLRYLGRLSDQVPPTNDWASAEPTTRS